RNGTIGRSVLAPAAAVSSAIVNPLLYGEATAETVSHARTQGQGARLRRRAAGDAVQGFEQSEIRGEADHADDRRARRADSRGGAHGHDGSGEQPGADGELHQGKEAIVDE